MGIAIRYRRVRPLLLVVLVWPFACGATDDLLGRAAACSDFDGCTAIMLKATDPRRPAVIHAAAARLSEVPKPPKGNRKGARDLNAKGLAALKRSDVETAVVIFRKAAAEDASDVEVQSNLGYSLLKAGRAIEAAAPLRNALALDPRRTTAWTSMAECLLGDGKQDLAVAALLLGYEFSANRDRTLAYYEENSRSAERKVMEPTYALAVQRLQKQESASTVTAVAPLQSKAEEALTRKKEVLDILRASGAENLGKEIPAGFPQHIAENLTECLLDKLADIIARQIEGPINKTTIGRVAPNKDEVEALLINCMASSGALKYILEEEARKKGGHSAESRSRASMAVSDLILDYRSLAGRSVSVRGHFFALGELNYLYEKAGAMTFVMVDTSQLSRNDRRKLLTECSLGCSVTVNGTAEDVMFQKGIRATSLGESGQ
jgi:tetratricopeptide (TPR) repeat protein